LWQSSFSSTTSPPPLLVVVSWTAVFVTKKNRQRNENEFVDPVVLELRLRSGDEQLPESFADEIIARQTAFRDRFRTAFPIPQTMNGAGQRGPLEESALHAVSNLLGGIGFWHGTALVRNASGAVVPYGPLDSFSAVPSRPWSVVVVSWTN
jgi:hypothetical protein